MKVKFYVLQKNTETGKPREKYLFQSEHTEMFIDKQIVHKETKYQVKSLEWSDQVAGVLKAVCLVVPGPKGQR